MFSDLKINLNTPVVVNVVIVIDGKLTKVAYLRDKPHLLGDPLTSTKGRMFYENVF